MLRTGALLFRTLCFAAVLVTLSMAPSGAGAAASAAAGVAAPGGGAGAAAGALAKPIELRVDAGDAPRGIFHSRLVIPAAPGPLALAYPKWIQGEHTPSGPITELAGLTVTALGRTLPWRRDPLEMFVFRVEVPDGADAVTVAFDYLSPPAGFGSGYGETPNATPHLAIVDWHDLLVYPVGRAATEIPIRASLRLPAGW